MTERSCITCEFLVDHLPEEKEKRIKESEAK